MGQRRCETRIQTGFPSWIQQERYDIFVNFGKKPQYLTISFKIKIQNTYENQNQNGIALDIKILWSRKIYCSRRRLHVCEYSQYYWLHQESRKR